MLSDMILSYLILSYIIIYYMLNEGWEESREGGTTGSQRGNEVKLGG